ncbi:protein of unknown function [Cupriavidus taiwanensis]|nr:protein of unknown function [Cupriavidus taiwanensis]
MCESSVDRVTTVSRLGCPLICTTPMTDSPCREGRLSKRHRCSLHSTFFGLVCRYGLAHTVTLSVMNVLLRGLFDVGLVNEPLKHSDRRYRGELQEQRKWKTAR